MIKRLISRLFDEKLEFRLRIFNMLALGGIIISYMMAIITVFQGGTAMMALMNAAAGTGALLLTALTNISADASSATPSPPSPSSSSPSP